MPIKPERKALYPDNWEKISLYIKERAGWKCELCQADHGKPHPITRSEVILTVHHINGDPTDNRRINLIALCQRCHNRLDLPFRRKRKRYPLFEGSRVIQGELR
jgi:5-methylcytosine-specific restriction endonuclease McrA